MKRKKKKYFFFDLVQIKNSFGHFRKLKSNTKLKLVSNFIGDKVFIVKGKLFDRKMLR